MVSQTWCHHSLKCKNNPCSSNNSLLLFNYSFCYSLATVVASFALCAWESTTISVVDQRILKEKGTTMEIWYTWLICCKSAWNEEIWSQMGAYSIHTPSGSTNVIPHKLHSWCKCLHGSHMDRKNLENLEKWEKISSQWKVRKFWTDWKSQGNLPKNAGEMRELYVTQQTYGDLRVILGSPRVTYYTSYTFDFNVNYSYLYLFKIKYIVL